MDFDCEVDLNQLRKSSTLSGSSSSGTVTSDSLKHCSSMTGDGKRSGDDGDVEASLNPLEINLIFNQILSYLTLKALLICRLVNRSWNTEAISWIQDKTMNRFRYSHRPDDFPRICLDFENSDACLLTTLSINLEGLCLKDCAVFFKKHGVHIRNITIIYTSNCRFLFRPEDILTEDDLKILRFILQYVPNLTTLCLESYFDRESATNFSFDNMELLEVILPQVVSLRLDNCYRLAQCFLNGLFLMVPNVKTIDLRQGWNERCSYVFAESLQKLNVQKIIGPSFEDAPGLWRSLAGMDSTKLKLNVLQMRLEKRFPNSQEELLKSQTEFLEVLTLQTKNRDDVDDLNRPRLKLPVMKRLKKLTIAISYVDVNPSGSYPIFPINPEQLPSIQVLCVEPQMIQNVFANSIYTTVREVRFDGSRWYDKPNQIFPGLRAMLPNLRKFSFTNFRGFMNALTMSTMFENLENIEHLELGLIGVGNAELMQNRSLAVCGVPAEVVECSTLPSLLNPPAGLSLRDLKRLKRLSLHILSGYHVTCSAVIDDISVNVTFLNLPPKVHLTLRGDFSISEALAAKLTAHFQNIYFIPNHD